VSRATDRADHERLVQSRALGDPTRNAVFLYVRDASAPVTVAELTEHFGLNHNAIRQHLGKLLEAGLVTEHRNPPAGRGRPPVRYRAVPGAAERWGSTPAYEALSLMLLDLLRTGGTPVEVGRAVGRRMAEDHGADADAVEILDAVARRLGFEPRVEQRRTGAEVVLDRCPFVDPAFEAPEIVCELHRGVAEGIADRAADHAVVTDLVIRPPDRAKCRIKVANAPSRA
jgi:predicted ArsR family transcriptional regulator